MRVTLSYKRLAGVKENLAALYNHALYCQVFPDVLGLAHFIMHYSKKAQKQHKKAPFCHSHLELIHQIQKKLKLGLYMFC